MRLQDKIAVITGGNSGIGLAIAEAFKTEGAAGIILGRNAGTLETAGKKLAPNFTTVRGDVTKMADLETLYKEVAAQHDHIDILVVNAGGATFQPFDQVDEASFDQQADLNFKGTFFTVQKALPLLREGASIILVSSVAQSKGIPGMTVYSGAKAAVRSLARSLSAELIPRGVRVNVISPGPIETPLFNRVGLPEDQIPGAKDGFIQMVPLKRIGTVKEVANAAVFLASDDSTFIVGEEIQVDGGLVNL